MRPRWVKKRDGRRVPYDPRRLHASLVAAADEAGESLLVDEICEVIEHYLEKASQRAVPSTVDIQDLVERVLLETNHARTAAAFASRGAATERSRQALVIDRREAPVLGIDGELPDGPALGPWSDAEVVRALEAAGVEPALAEEVAATVERRVLALGLRRVTARLVREVTELELEERGLGVRLAPADEIAVPVRAIRKLTAAAFHRREREDGPARPVPGPEALVGRDVLHRFALADGLPAPVARAHQDGIVHLVGLGMPLRVLSGAVALDHLKAALGERAPASAAEVAAALAALLHRAEACHDRAIGVPWANVFLAPFARGREAAVRRDLREAYRVLAAASPEPALRLHLGPVPEALAHERPLGRRGKRWRAGYGDLAGEAARVARLLVEIAAEDQPLAGLGRPELVASLSLLADLPEGAALDAVLVDAPGLEPPASSGLAPAAALAGRPGPVPFVAGAARAIGIGCGQAAFAAGPADEPALRAALEGALDLALDGCEASLRALEQALFRARLPLWNALGEGRPAPVVEAARATFALGLVGLDEAFEHLLGEAPAQNPAVRELATRLVRHLAHEARERAARRGFRARLEEPPLDLGARRLAELDLGARGDPARRVLERNGAEPCYSTGLCRPPASAAEARAALDEVYGPLGLAPVLASGPALRARAAAYREALG